jgi:hypothetical protein
MLELLTQETNDMFYGDCEPIGCGIWSCGPNDCSPISCGPNSCGPYGD